MRHKPLGRIHTNHTVFWITSWLVTVWLASMLLIGQAVAGPESNQHRQIHSEDGKPIQVDPEVTATIQKKTSRQLITISGDGYRMSPATIIVSEDGSQVSLKKLKVPCEARITYKRVKGVRTALRVQILNTGSDASTVLIYESPE